MPNVSGEDVKEAEWRQNRARQFLLNVDVSLNDVGIRTQAAFAESVDILAVKTFVETDLVPSWLRMDCRKKMERRSRKKWLGGDAEKNSERENDRQQNNVGSSTSLKRNP